MDEKVLNLNEFSKQIQQVLILNEMIRNRLNKSITNLILGNITETIQTEIHNNL